MSQSPPLAGLRVLELARILAGPWIGQLLADLGADVVKVEAPVGDDPRKWGPPFVEGGDGEHRRGGGRVGVGVGEEQAHGVERTLSSPAGGRRVGAASFDGLARENPSPGWERGRGEGRTAEDEA